MTHGERKMLSRGVAAGTLVGLAVGLLIAVLIALEAPSAVWLPSVLVPLALVAGWWGAQELAGRGRGASPPGG